MSRKNSVLIVDDDIKIATLLKAYFEKDGFSVYLAHEGYQALEKIKEQQPDIIILRFNASWPRRLGSLPSG